MSIIFKSIFFVLFFSSISFGEELNKIGTFKMAGNPIKMSPYKDPDTRGEIPDLDQHRKKILDEFS